MVNALADSSGAEDKGIVFLSFHHGVARLVALSLSPIADTCNLTPF
jgi:hypothetical protein